MAFRKRKQDRERDSEGCIIKYFRVASPIDDAVNDYVSDHSYTTEESHIEPPAPSPQADGPIAQPIDEDNILNNLGLVIKESMTDSEVSTSVAGLNAGQKYTLLTNLSVMGVVDRFS